MRLVPALGLLLTMAAPALSQEACGSDPGAWLEANPEALDGFWSSENTAMIMVSPQVGTMDMGAQGVSTFSLTARDGGLLGESGEEGSVPIMLYPDGRNLVIEPPEILANQFDGDEIGILLGCDVANLPVLHSAAEVEGTTARTEMTALVAGPDRMLVWVHFQSPMGDIYMSYTSERWRRSASVNGAWARPGR